jgi:hypothetical protein
MYILSWFIQTNVAVNALTGDGSKQNSNDQATLNGMPVAIFKKLVKAVESNTFESYIGEKKCWAFI